MKKENVKPCPFCGEELVFKEGKRHSWWAHKDRCGSCLLQQVSLFDMGDVEKWNTRPDVVEKVG